MPIAVTCQSCLATFNVRAELAGKLRRCRQCGNRVRVPEEERSLLPRTASQRTTRRPRPSSQPSLAKQRSGSQPSLARPRSGSQPSLAKRRSGVIETEESRPVWPALAAVFACALFGSLVILLLHELGG